VVPEGIDRTERSAIVRSGEPGAAPREPRRCAPSTPRTRSSPASRTNSAPRWFFTLISFTLVGPGDEDRATFPTRRSKQERLDERRGIDREEVGHPPRSSACRSGNLAGLPLLRPSDPDSSVGTSKGKHSAFSTFGPVGAGDAGDDRVLPESAITMNS